MNATQIAACIEAGEFPDDEVVIKCIEDLRTALRWTERNFRLAVQGKPVRDMAENLAFNETVAGWCVNCDGLRWDDGAPCETCNA